MKIGIIAKTTNAENAPHIIEIVNWLRSKGVDLFLDHDTARFINTEGGVSKTKLPEDVDIMLVLGGDGTFLSASRLVIKKQVPLLGVNLGGLGFLTEVGINEVKSVLERVLSGDYTIENRMILVAHVHRHDERIADYSIVNDVVINKGALARIIRLEMYINGSYVCAYKADGLIISTPMGSTAYSLSAGGPIVHPSLNSIIVTPICAHSLTNRPLVVPDDSKIKIVVKETNGEVFLTLDGQVGFSIDKGDVIEVKRSDTHLKVIKSPLRNYYEILRTKLRWGEI